MQARDCFIEALRTWNREARPEVTDYPTVLWQVLRSLGEKGPRRHMSAQQMEDLISKRIVASLEDQGVLVARLVNEVSALVWEPMHHVQERMHSMADGSERFGINIGHQLRMFGDPCHVAKVRDEARVWNEVTSPLIN